MGGKESWIAKLGGFAGEPAGGGNASQEGEFESAVQFAEELAGDVERFRMGGEIHESFTRKGGLDMVAEFEARVKELRDAWPELILVEGENLGFASEDELGFFEGHSDGYVLCGGKGVDVPDPILVVDEARKGPLGVLGNRVGEEPDGAEVQEILHRCLLIYLVLGVVSRGFGRKFLQVMPQ